MKLLLPKEHGAWAMWIAPYIIGIFLSEFKWVHIIMLIAIFFAYISISPFLQGIRRPVERKEMWKYSFYYLSIAGLLGLPILFFYPKLTFLLLVILPFLLINIFYVKRRKERAFTNDLAAVFALSSTIMVSYFIGAEQYDAKMFSAWILTVLFFLGSIFYVKSAIRERNNTKFKLLAKIYTIALPVFGWLFADVFLMLAYLFSAVRILLLPYEKNVSSKKIGIIEIFNTIWFVIFIAISFNR